MNFIRDYQTIHKPQRQLIVDLHDHLSCLSAALKEIREQKYALFAQQHAISAQQQALSTEESTLMQEELAILAQLSGLCERSK